MTLKQLYKFIDVEMLDRLTKYDVEIEDVIIHDSTMSELKFKYHVSESDDNFKIRAKLLKFVESEIVLSYLKDNLNHGYCIEFTSHKHGLSAFWCFMWNMIKKFLTFSKV